MALAHPWSQNILQSAATMDGAASRREDIKHSKYSKEQLPGGYTPTFISLVFSTLVGGEKKHQHSSINFPNYIEMKKEKQFLRF